LGVSIIKNKQTKATELGHTKYSPLKKYEETKKIIKQFRKKEFLEMEDYVSGEGIENLYNYYKQKELSADKIARKRNICKSAKKTFEAFFELYADVILKLIKKTNANRVILVGNITNQYLEDLEKRSFLKNFDNYKGSIKVVKRLDVGLLGATKI
jgi:glucokinase